MLYQTEGFPPDASRWHDLSVKKASNQLCQTVYRSKSCKNSRNSKESREFLAGAEGLGLACRLGRRQTVATGDQRPSARGFGVDVGKSLRRNGFRLFQPLVRLLALLALEIDAFLMLLSLLMDDQPLQQFLITPLSGGHRQHDIRKFLLRVYQLYPVERKKHQHSVGADPLIPIQKRMVPHQSKAEPRRLLLERRVNIRIPKSLEGCLQR